MNETLDPKVVCNKCGNILIKGKRSSIIFGPGTSIECKKCGEKYIFGKRLIVSGNLGRKNERE